ncbi:MAG: DUF2007 domain-containing protein [Anaerolineae bacterium]|nr:DUF2007 domain-containing protein [Anaerolineae bacterium]
MPELVVVYVSMGLLEAEVIKGKLEAAGIPALLSYESAGPVIGIIIDGLGEVKVQVPQEFEAEARTLIEPLEAGEEVGDEEWVEDEGG